MSAAATRVLAPTPAEQLERWEPLCQAIVRQYFAPGHEREDLLQEARLAVFEALDAFRSSRGSLPSFVSLVVRRRVITAVKTATRQKHRPLNHSERVVRSEDGEEHDALDFVAAGSATDPHAVLVAREELGETLRRMDQLSDLERAAVVGFANGASYEELAAAERSNVKAIDNAIQRGRQRLRGQPRRVQRTQAKAPPPAVSITPEKESHMPIVEAIDAEIAKHEHTLGRLRALRESAVEIESPGAGETDSSLGGTPPAAVAAPTPEHKLEQLRGAGKPPDSGSKPGRDNAALGRAKRDQVMAYMHDGHQEVTVSEVADLLGVSGSSAYGHLRRLEGTGEISVLGSGRKGDPKRYVLPDAEVPVTRPKLAPRSGRSTSAAQQSRQAKNMSRGAANAAKVLAAVEAAGREGVTPLKLVERTGLSRRVVQSATERAVRSGRLVVDERESIQAGDGRQRYRSAELGLAPADEHGARTQLERDVLAAVREVGPATADGPGGIHEWVRENREGPVPMVRSVRMVAEGLVRRGVLRRDAGRFELAEIGVRREAA